MKNADKESFLQDYNVIITKVEVQLLFILGLLIGPSQPGIFTKSLFFNLNSSTLIILTKLSQSYKISFFNVSYSALKSTAQA